MLAQLDEKINSMLNTMRAAHRLTQRVATRQASAIAPTAGQGVNPAPTHMLPPVSLLVEQPEVGAVLLGQAQVEDGQVQGVPDAGRLAQGLERRARVVGLVDGGAVGLAERSEHRQPRQLLELVGPEA